MKRTGIVALEILAAVVIYLIAASAMTWPMVSEMETQVVGGGEFGGWLWRQWWHFQEIEALADAELGALDHLRHLVGLGRYPETGNILDVLLISYPLDQLLGFPWHHNVKVLLILVGNGLCAYGLARTYTDSRWVGLAAGMVAVVNPLAIQDVNGTGLRQVMLWWLLLFPITVRRATRTGKSMDGVWVGVCFTLVATFYWFYGLFAAMFGLVWVVHDVITKRPGWRRVVRWMLPAAVVAIVGVVVFLLPYFAAGQTDAQRSGMDLPELSFFLSFPAYDTIAAAPLRPGTYEENILSSLRRVIVSAWPADHVVNPFHGVQSFPFMVFIAGVIPAFFVRRARLWLGVWVLFWVGTMGPFLKLGADKDTTDVIMLGDYVLRMPYVWMFKWVPGMSRMFAPYRMSSMMVVASVVLVAIGLGALRNRWRIPASLLVMAGVAIQPFWHIDTGPVPEGVQEPPLWRIPTTVSPFSVPDWYMEMDPEVREGIIELPLEQQQDLMCVYQVFHQQKLYKSWAGAPAVPPVLRQAGGGEAGTRLRWLASAEPGHGTLGELLLSLSRDPIGTDLGAMDPADLLRLMDKGDYRWMIVHERGYYLVDPYEGGVLYRDAVRRVGERLQLTPLERYEHGLGVQEDTHLLRDVAPAWIPMAGKDASIPLDQVPRRMMMAIFDLDAWSKTQVEDATQAAEPVPTDEGSP